MDINKILEESLQINKKYKRLKKKTTKDVFKAKMEKEHPFLAENYGAILNIAVGESYNYTRLKEMLTLANKVKNNEIKEHDASVQVGKILVDEIVKPSLEKK